MSNKIITIIGGPGSGKTTLINGLQENGYTCYPEISREITLQARHNGVEQLFLQNPLLFSELLLEGRIEQYRQAVKDTAPLVFIDRGLPDIVAYMHYIGNSYPSVFNDACNNHKYTHVFFLPPWQEIYTADEARYENFEQAGLIARHLMETYTQYGYKPVEVPKDTVDNRISFILGQLS